MLTATNQELKFVKSADKVVNMNLVQSFVKKQLAQKMDASTKFVRNVNLLKLLNFWKQLDTKAKFHVWFVDILKSKQKTSLQTHWIIWSTATMHLLLTKLKLNKQNMTLEPLLILNLLKFISHLMTMERFLLMETWALLLFCQKVESLQQLTMLELLWFVMTLFMQKL